MMKSSLIALAACCAFAGSAFARSHFSLTDDQNVHPPHFSLTDDQNVHPPHVQ